MTLEGVVLEPDGTPAEGALVVSRAGGRAITDASGAYRLVVSVPPDQRDVSLTAIGNGGVGRLVRTSVTLSSERTRVEPLTLELGASCEPRWLPTFGVQPGTDYAIEAFTVYDDGSGPALFIGGSFEVAGDVWADHIAKWDGTSWSSLGGGCETVVHALTVFDDGSGPALYAGGAFWTAGGVTVNKIARWDGTSWSALGVGINGSGPRVRALAVYDDGSGPALYAAGEFTSAGGAPASRIAKWNGSAWSALGSGLTGTLGGSSSAYALAVYDDGGGTGLYVGGGFIRAGGVLRNGIAKWNGSAWSSVGGANGMNGPVRALATFDGGGGLELYAGGDFTTASGTAASFMARWNGTSWSPVGSGTSSAVHALRVVDDGKGPALFAGGAFATAGSATANGIARWDGSDWSALGSGTTGGYESYPPVLALAAFDDGGGSALFAGGYLTGAGGIGAKYIARWDGASWSALGNGLSGGVAALTVFDDGSGPALYAGGGFLTSGAGAARIARWDGSSWSPLGSGVEPSVPGEYVYVQAFAAHDDGSGPALYAGGRFTSAGGVAANSIARWDGASWSSLGSGVAGATSVLEGVFALASFDDGSGPALYAGGAFTSAGGQPASRIAKWDGSAWHPLGTGMNSVVYCLTVYDDGAGPALYAGGNFLTAGGATVNKVARWDGASWSALGSGIGSAFGFPPDVRALQVHDDGGGPALFAGGRFILAGGIEAHGIARWRGGSWSALTLTRNVDVYSLGIFDDGSGPALYAGGTFLGLQGVGKWNGSSWTMLGTPMPYSVFGHVPFALASHDDGSGPALFAAGTSLESGDTHLSKWGYPEDLDPPELACPAAIEVADGLGGPSGESVDFAITASDCRDPAPSVVCVPPSGSFFPRGTTLVTCTATDASGNQSSCQFPVIVQPKARRP